MRSRMTVNRSDSVRLHCAADANPLPYETVWSRNGSTVLRQEHLAHLHIEHAQLGDSGFYTCTVHNRFHNNLTSDGSSVIELIVQNRPIIETTYSKLAGEIGQTIALVCRASGRPKPDIVWKRHDRTIPCSEMRDDRCYLEIFNMTAADFGLYRCVAENLLGREEWIYTVVSRGESLCSDDETE